MNAPGGGGSVCAIGTLPGVAVMAEEIARCPHCGAVQGGPALTSTGAAVVAVYAEVARIRAAAEEAGRAREAELLREIRLLRETVARLRGG